MSKNARKKALERTLNPPFFAVAAFRAYYAGHGPAATRFTATKVSIALSGRSICRLFAGFMPTVAQVSLVIMLGACAKLQPTFSSVPEASKDPAIEAAADRNAQLTKPPGALGR